MYYNVFTGFFGKNGFAHLESANFTLIIEANGDVTFSDGIIAFYIHKFINIF